jgi:hypothetical protein
MANESNGSTSPVPSFPVTPAPDLPPVPGWPGADLRVQVSPDTPGQPGLADDDRRRRWNMRMHRLLAAADHLMLTRVKHPDGGERTVAETRADEDEQRQLVSRETAMGSRKHHQLPHWLSWVPRFVLFFDFALLLYFFAGITNVNWHAALSTELGFAVTLAGMVTLLSYGFLSFTGHRMRSYKNHAGTVHLDELDGFTKAAFGTAMMVVAVLAALMYVRIHSEVLIAAPSGAGLTALGIPLAVAVVSAVANLLVVLIHTLDGSDEVARLDALAAATRRPSRQADRLRQRAAQQAHR